MRRLLITLITFFIFFLVSSPAIAQEKIQSFDANIVINKDGTVKVEEKIVYDFSNFEKHGIYREIPFVKTNNAGKKFRLDFRDFSVVDESDKPYRYSKTINPTSPFGLRGAGNQQLTIKIGDPDKTISGLHTYLIRYQVAGALTYFSDHDELYWNATGNDWPVPIIKSSTQVIVPSGTNLKTAASKLVLKCFTGLKGSTEQNCSYDAQDSQVNFQSLSQFNPGEGLTVVVNFPKNIVSVLEPKPYLTFWETFFGKSVAGLLIVAAFIWYVIYPIKIPIKWLQQGRDPKPRGSSEARAWFDPPKNKDGRPLTPEETGALVDERADMEDVSGMIVSLAQKGYLKIKEKEKGDFYLIKSKDHLNSEDLVSFEETFLYGLFKDGNKIHLKKSKLYDLVEAVKANIYQQLVSEGFFLENPNKVRGFYTLIGGFALATLNIALAFSAFFFGRNMPRKTVVGAEASNVAKSLRNFLSSQERQLEFQAKNQIMFEKLLPYAIVFGVEKIWAERFKDIDLKPPDWYSGYGTARFNSIYFANSLNSSFSSLQSAATPTSSSSGFGSGFSGGSSGGGGGGGGGRSW